MSAVAKSKKSVSLKLGKLWAVAVEVKANTEAASPVEAPVEVEFSGPGTSVRIRARHQGKGVHTALCATSAPGEWVATVFVGGPNADVVDGFTATVKQ